MDIINNKFRIRNAKEKDAKLLTSWWNDGQVMAHAGFPNGLGITEKKVTEFINEDTDLNRRLILEFEENPIGEMNYRTLEDGVAEIGIKICDASQQNKGYGTEFLKMLMKQIFTKMNYGKIILDTNLNNERAIKVYDKLGFRRVRTTIDSWKDQLGDHQSSVEYEMTKKDYVNLQAIEIKSRKKKK